MKSHLQKAEKRKNDPRGAEIKIEQRSTQNIAITIVTTASPHLDDIAILDMMTKSGIDISAPDVLLRTMGRRAETIPIGKDAGTRVKRIGNLRKSSPLQLW